MTSSADASTSTTNPNPLYDDDLSELTKKEILFWARKLQLSPSELFTLSKQELEVHLERVQREELYDEQRKSQYEKWERLAEMKRFLLEEERRQRLKGGVTPRRTIWDILYAAANEIESMYGDSQAFSDSSGAGSSCLYSDSVGSNYASTSFGGFKTPPVPNMCSTIYEMHPEDSQYTPPDFPSTLSATPISYGTPQHRNAMNCPQRNATYNVSAANATYDICAPGNATYNAKRTSRASTADATYNACASRNATFGMPRTANATYNVCPSQNATYNVPRSANATYGTCKQATSATYNIPHSNANATYNVPQRSLANATSSKVCPNATYNVAGTQNQTSSATSPRGRGNVTFDVGPPSADASSSFRPNAAMASTPKHCPRTGRKPYFRNYTDYSMTLSGTGISEASQSVSYDVFSDKKSMVRAAARTYSIPNRSLSCPPSGRTHARFAGPARSGSNIRGPRCASRTRSPTRSESPVQAIAAANYGFSPTARPPADRSYGWPRRLCEGKMRGFCDCAQRSRSVPPRC
ncbi:uncharacterized protein [Eurosta solidaginis]|uniref:uncharacterized protein n=1 Tax=Eurosta solidaginis TaxID=178769 RepID=UPI003531307C